ncbi:hypothetical protein ABMA28_004355, partial [Loxostege sticticalis]
IRDAVYFWENTNYYLSFIRPLNTGRDTMYVISATNLRMCVCSGVCIQVVKSPQMSILTLTCLDDWLFCMCACKFVFK